MPYEAIVIGTSAGGLNALQEIFRNLDKKFSIPIMVVQHLHAQSDNYLVKVLDALSALTVKEAEEKERIKKGTIYFAPPNYHLLVEEDRTLSLSTDNKVNYCRPSIDVLFESAVEVYQHGLIGMILTGANDDGTQGMIKIKEKGGLLIVEDPKTAEVASMPMSVINQVDVQYVLPVREIAPLLQKINDHNESY